MAQLVARLLWEHAGSGDAPAGKNALRAKSKATKSLAIIEKTPLKTLTFSDVTLFKKTPTKCFDHRFDHLRKLTKNRIFFTLRGVAQLVARDVWDVDAAGSNPVTPTKIADLTVFRSNRCKFNMSPEAVYRSTVMPD